jgi:hypothetical protein
LNRNQPQARAHALHINGCDDDLLSLPHPSSASFPPCFKVLGFSFSAIFGNFRTTGNFTRDSGDHGDLPLTSAQKSNSICKLRPFWQFEES